MKACVKKREVFIYLVKYFSTVCNLQSMKSPVELKLNSLLSKFFFMPPGLMRHETGGLAN